MTRCGTYHLYLSSGEDDEGHDQPVHSPLFASESLRRFADRCGVVKISDWTTDVIHQASLALGLVLEVTTAKSHIKHPLQGKADRLRLLNRHALNHPPHISDVSLISTLPLPSGWERALTDQGEVYYIKFEMPRINGS